MATRKRYGLSGSPAHHAKEAEKASIQAVREYNNSVRQAEGRYCLAALDALHRGAQAAGFSRAHDLEAGQALSVSATGRVVDAAAAADRVFEARCMGARQKLGIAGLRRRSRR